MTPCSKRVQSFFLFKKKHPEETLAEGHSKSHVDEMKRNTYAYTLKEPNRIDKNSQNLLRITHGLYYCSGWVHNTVHWGKKSMLPKHVRTPIDSRPVACYSMYTRYLSLGDSQAGGGGTALTHHCYAGTGIQRQSASETWRLHTAIMTIGCPWSSLLLHTPSRHTSKAI